MIPMNQELHGSILCKIARSKQQDRSCLYIERDWLKKYLTIQLSENGWIDRAINGTN